MKDIISMLIEKDLLVVVILGIIIILFLILFVVLILADKNKKQEKTIDKEDKIEILNISKPTKEDIISEEVVQKNEIIETDEKIEVKEQKEDENISDIAGVLASMQASLEERDQKTIDSFEQEQEKNAIISYQELVNACKKNKENELITETKKEVKEEFKEEVVKQEPAKKFKNSEFISPIYGKEKKKEDSLKQFINKNFDNQEEVSYSKEINTPIEAEFDLEELQKEMKENEDFLEELKNFRNSL